MMILVNSMEKIDKLSISDYQTLLILLSPFAPHITEGIWQKLGNKDSISQEPWPDFDPKLVKEEEIELVVQVNGKVRDKIVVPADISQQDAEKQALASDKVNKWLDNKQPKKVIYVPAKLVNIVV